VSRSPARRPGPPPVLVVGLTLILASCASRGPGPETPNVALGRAVWVVSGGGNPAVVTDGRLATEGTLDAALVVALRDVRSEITVDLGSVQPVGAFLLQAGTADVYFVETSTDGATWSTRWRVSPIQGLSVLRTRTRVLPGPVPARWLRVRPTTARAPAVSEIMAFPSAPAAWPALDRTHVDSPLPLWPDLTEDRVATVYSALGALLLALVTWGVATARTPPSRREDRRRRVALLALAAAALLAWPNLLNFHYTSVVHKWEFFHYYMGGKYLPELGYTRLYTCAAVVDAEDGIDLRGLLMRDLRDNRPVPATTLIARADECHSRFTPRRWDQFRHDLRFFRGALGEAAWTAVRNDHGFNGTPAWALVGGLLARSSPASWTQIHALAALDFLLLLAIFIVLGRVFGLEAACLGAAYWGLSTLARWGWTGGGFLRYDWIFWLVLGIAALRARRPALAGFALAWSSLLRVLPVYALAGLALKALVEVAQARSLRPLRRHRRFVAGGAAAAALVLASSSLAAGRASIWAEFADNSARHVATESVNMVGLPVFLAYHEATRIQLMTDPLLQDRHSTWTSSQDSALRAVRPTVVVAGLAFVLLLALAVRTVPDWAALVLGLGLLPMLMKVSGYYYAAYVVFATLPVVAPATALALAAFTWVTTVIPGLWPSLDSTYAWLSLAVSLFAIGVTGGIAWRGVAHDPAGDEDGSGLG